MTDQEKNDYIQKLLEEAYSFYEKNELEKSLDCLEKISKIDPNNASVFSLKASTLDELGKYQEAITAHKKAANLFDDNKNKGIEYFLIAIALYKSKKYIEAIETYNKAIELFEDNNDKANALYNKGIILHELEKHQKAIKTYNKAIELFENNNDRANAYLNKGNALSDLKRQIKAIEAYDKATELFEDNNDKAKAFLNKGNALYDLKKQIEAIEAYNKAANLFKDDNDKAKAYLNKGNTLRELKKNEDAIIAYDESINRYQEDKNKAKAYLLKAITLEELKRYEEAITASNKAIELFEENNDRINTYLLKSIILCELQDYRQAIIELKEALKLNSNLKNANQLIALSYLKLETWKKAGEFFGKEGTETIEIISSLDEEDEIANVSDIICSHLKHKPNDYFWKVLERTNVCKTADRPCDQHTESCSNCKIEQACGVYRDIYLKSLQIITHVQVNFAFEEKVAHYTTKDSARLLLLGKNSKKVSEDDKKPSKFRLASTARANDPKEGQTLFDYLLGNQQQTPLGTADSNYRAFIGCFTFNHQSLNQFRLYGKEKGREASGVSIVIKKDYFNKKIGVTQNMKANFVSIDKNIEASTEKEDQKLPLFRCIYIDPETEAVISLGHKELYAYIREEMDTKNEKKIDINDLRYNYGEYLKNIEEQLDNVTELFEELKELVSNPDLNPQTISELLLMLSHLVKHVAFKEEQECRILEIASLTDGDETVKVESEIDNNCYRMFIDYLPMTNSVDRLYMGNQFEDFAMFKDLIKQQYQGKVKCLISTHPFAIT